MAEIAIVLIALLSKLNPAITLERINQVMIESSEVVTQELESGSLKKEHADDALVALLAVIAVESGLKESVENCTSSGDNGRSIGLGQVMKGPNWEGLSRAAICNSRKIQLKLALHVIERCWAKKPDAVFRCYTTGDPNLDSSTARYENYVYSTIKKKFTQNSSK